jgi:hypothetical protein
MAHPSKESLSSSILSLSPQKLPNEGTTSIPTQPSISTLRRGRDRKKTPVKTVSTWIRNHGKEPRTLIELKGNIFFSITRKNYTYIFI